MFVGRFSGGAQEGVYSIHRITRNWVEDEADWKNASDDTPWTTPGGDYNSKKIDEITVALIDNHGFKSFNVLETVKDFIVNPDQNFGFLLRNSQFAQEIDIASNDFETAEYRPKLTIEYKVSAVDLTQKRVRCQNVQSPVKLTTFNRKLHVANNSTMPVCITLTRLDGATFTSEMVPRGVRKMLPVRSAGVYLISVAGNNFIMNEKASFFH